MMKEALQVESRSLFKPTQELVGTLYDSFNDSDDPFRLSTFREGNRRDVVVFRVGTSDPLAIAVDPDGRKKQIILDSESVYYQSVMKDINEPVSPQKEDDVNLAWRTINNQHVGVNEPCGREAVSVLYTNPDAVRILKTPSYVVGPSDLPVVAGYEDGSGPQQNIVLEDVMIIQTTRREGPVVIYPLVSKEEFDERKRRAQEKLDAEQKLNGFAGKRTEKGKKNNRKR